MNNFLTLPPLFFPPHVAMPRPPMPPVMGPPGAPFVPPMHPIAPPPPTPMAERAQPMIGGTKTAATPSEDEPAPKKQKTEDSLVPEDEFIKKNKVFVILRFLLIFLYKFMSVLAA